MKQREKWRKATRNGKGSQEYVQHMSSDRDTLVRQRTVLRKAKLTENPLAYPKAVHSYVP